MKQILLNPIVDVLVYTTSYLHSPEEIFGSNIPVDGLFVVNIELKRSKKHFYKTCHLLKQEANRP